GRRGLSSRRGARSVVFRPSKQQRTATLIFRLAVLLCVVAKPGLGRRQCLLSVVWSKFVLCWTGFILGIQHVHNDGHSQGHETNTEHMQPYRPYGQIVQMVVDADETLENQDSRQCPYCSTLTR